MELTRSDGAYVEQVVDSEHVEVVAGLGKGGPPVGTRVAYPGSATEETVRGRSPVVLSELKGLGTGIAPYLTETCGKCEALLSPLSAGDALLGSLVLLRSPGRVFRDEHVDTVRSLGDLASVSLRLVTDISHEREERTALLDSTQEGIYGIDPAGRCTFLNRFGARLLGYDDPEEVLGVNMHQTIHHTRPDGSDYPESSCPIYGAAREGEGVRVDNEVLWRKDGTAFPAEYGSYPIREGDRILGAVVTFRDISERKRVEKLRARQLDREKLLAEASSVLASSLDYEVTLRSVARLAVPRLADYCLIDVLAEDGRLHRVGASHVSPPEEELLSRARSFAPPSDPATPARVVLDSGEPEYVPEVTDAWLDSVAQDAEHREIMRRLDPRSVLVVPLVARGRTTGLLWLARTAPTRPYSPEDLELAMELGRRAGVSVDNAGLYADAREARGEAERRAREESALREAIAAVAASASTEEVIHRIAGSAVRATNADGAFVERIDTGSGESVVVAAAGETAPSVGSRLPYGRSFTQHVVERAEPLIVRRLADAGLSLPVGLADARPDDAALVLPLVDGGEPIGALFLLRTAEKWQFRDDEVQRAHSFAALAALAFRKIHMLEESEQRREELQRVMESRARLMRGFSHDVKNPLGAADGNLQLLEDGIVGELSGKQVEHVGSARRSIGSSLALIEDLLDLARAEAGQLELELGPVDVRDAARDLGEEYRAQAERKGLAMRLDLPTELPVIRSDASRVRQILGNLLSNAVKYTDQGEVRVIVEVLSDQGSRRPGDWIVARIHDTGPGIAGEQQRLLFQEFTRLDPDRQAGAGVGLAISQRIAHGLGGEITVESERGAGSTFTLWLPCTGPG